MVQLAEIYRLEKINSYFKEIGSKELLLTLAEGIPVFKGVRTFKRE